MEILFMGGYDETLKFLVGATVALSKVISVRTTSIWLAYSLSTESFEGSYKWVWATPTTFLATSFNIFRAFS